MSHLFEIIPHNFFSVLSSPNKDIYIDCIFIIYQSLDSLEDGFQGDRENIVSRLVDYFDDKSHHELEEEGVRTSRQKATYVINVLKQAGWIGEEELGDYKTSLNFFDYSIQIIDILDKIRTGSQNEYTGEIFAVYSILKSFHLEEGIGILEQAYQKTHDVIRKLRTLKANIYRYYHDITTKKNKQDLQALLEKLLVEYKENFFDRAYYNLKTKDSLPRYKQSIFQSVNAILNNEAVMDYMASEVMELKKIEDYNEAYLYVEERLRFIYDSFNSLELLIDTIDRKNEQYISAASSKILFLTNTSDDIEGLFNQLFKIIVDGVDINYNDIINLTQARNLDTLSLYNQRRHRIEAIPEEIFDMDDYITDELKQKQLRAIFKNTIFSKKEINSFVGNLFNGKESYQASDIEINNSDDYIRLLLIFLYSKSIGMSYEIELLNEKVESNFIKFNDFKIMKKGSKRWTKQKH